MADETLETPEESRLSRRTALKAAMGVGVGAVAWSGPHISAFGATPAYASGCTGFSLNIAFTNMSTNQSGTYLCYNDSPSLNLKMSQNGYGDYQTTLPGSGNFWCTDDDQVCASDGDEAGCYTFTFPAGQYCWISVKTADNCNGISGPYTGETEAEGTSPLEFKLPKVVSNVNSNTRWNVFLQCVPDGQESDLGECGPDVVFDSGNGCH